MRKEKLYLESEISELTRILSEIPEQNIIDRLSYEYRLQQLQEKLQNLPNTLPDTIILTFKGKPVHGIHGIHADFAGKMTEIISEAFAAFVEVAKGVTLGSGGAIPEFDKHKLLITGTAVGSFGFELELPKTESTSAHLSLLPQEDPIQKARLMLENVIEKAFEGDDDQLADSIESIDQRALDKVNEFYETLCSENATFTLKTKDRQIICSNMDKVKYAVGRLKKENIIDDHVTLLGCFRGFLPDRRDFEFRTEDGENLKGKVDKSVKSSEEINTCWLNKPVTVSFHTRKVGNGRPRYTLLSINDITSLSENSNG